MLALMSINAAKLEADAIIIKEYEASLLREAIESILLHNLRYK
jgi:hypothetical protein